jgi:SAM-dependent methyltransferase
MKPRSPAQDANRDEYRCDAIINIIKAREGKWIDAAERLIINEIADEVRSQPLLDIGVGTGRTAWLLRLISTDYVAVDYSPEMVNVCRGEYPGLDVRVGDARDLSAFADGHFKLVFFSFNGIDVLSHTDRERVLREIHRVLKPGGIFLYSTSNKNGGLYRARPWQVRERPGPRFFVRFLLGLPGSLPHCWRTYRNWWRRRRYAEDHGAWAMCTARAYEFTLVLHWTRPSTEADALRSAGFERWEFRTSGGAAITDDATACPWFYVLARK